MVDAPLALAFTAGMVAAVNPCGFAMLPAYLSWFVGGDDAGQAQPVAARLARALWVSVLVSASFVAVFAAAGVLITAGALVVIDVVPWLAAAVGLALVVMGVAMLRRGSRHVDRAAAVLRIVAGLYVTGYWVFTLAVPPGSADPPGWALIAEWPVSVVERMSSWSVNHVSRWAGPIAATLAVAVLAVLWKVLRRPPVADGEAEAVQGQTMEPTVSAGRGSGGRGRS